MDSSVVGFNPIAHFSALSDGLLDADTLPLMLLVKTPRVQDWNIQWLMWWWSIKATWSHHHSVHDARMNRNALESKWLGKWADDKKSF